MVGGLVSLDTSWYRAVNDLARDTPWAHGFLAAYALWAGLALLAVLLAVGWLLARHRRDAPRAVATAFLAGLGTIVALLVNQQAISPAVARTRPCHALQHVEVLLGCANDYSFPSDHSVIAGAFVAGLLLLDRRLGFAAVALALLVAFGRVYTGVHYPADAGGGLLIGGAIAATIVLTLRRPSTGIAFRLTGTPLRALIAAPGNDDARVTRARTDASSARQSRTPSARASECRGVPLLSWRVRRWLVLRRGASVPSAPAAVETHVVPVIVALDEQLASLDRGLQEALDSSYTVVVGTSASDAAALVVPAIVPMIVQARTSHPTAALLAVAVADADAGPAASLDAGAHQYAPRHTPVVLLAAYIRAIVRRERFPC